MNIKKFRIENYKSFRDSDFQELGPGFNVVIGANNSGKTALVEALSTRFLRLAPPDRESSVQIVFRARRDEVLEAVSRTAIEFPIVPPFTPEHVQNFFSQEYIDSEMVFLSNENTRVFEPSHKMFEFDMQHDRNNARHVTIKLDPASKLLTFTDSGQIQGDNYALVVCGQLRGRIFLFKAERAVVGRARSMEQKDLNHDFSNLPQVLNRLQGRDPAKFEEFNEHVQLIFPAIRHISVGAVGDECEILVWNTNSEMKEGSAIPLSQSGSGISQVLAMLYLILVSEFSKTIIIDEPSTFLHTGALRKLIEVMRGIDVSHQYIFTTHSPEVISVCDPDTLLICRWEDGQTVLERLDRTKLTDHRRAMREVGVRYSDVLGADRILWVEGATEEICFPTILRYFNSKALVGTAIIGLRNTGDLLAKRRSAKAVAEIYQKLSQGTNLFPITVAFSLDREGLSEADQAELRRRLGALVKFLPRRSFENYVLHPRAIAAVFGACAAFEQEPLTEDIVGKWIRSRGGQSSYYGPIPWDGELNCKSWLAQVDAPKLLEDLVSDLSCGTEYYKKLDHSVDLTEWLLTNEPSYLMELRDFLMDILSASEST